MQAVLAIVLGLALSLLCPPPAKAATPAWSVEVAAGVARLVLVWPTATRADLARAGDVARLRADGPLSAPAPSLVTRLAAWLDGASASPGGREVELRLRPAVIARLVQFHPRLTVIELEQGPLPPKHERTEAAAGEPAPRLPEPGAGPVWSPPVPRSRPGPADPVAPTATAPPPPAPAVAAAPEPQPDRGVTVAAAAAPDGLELRFRWAAAVPAAMFVRAGQFWAVFPDEGATVAGWRSLDRPEVTRWLEPVVTAAVGEARLFRFRVVAPLRIEPRPTADGWTVAVAPATAAAPDAGSSPWSRDARRGELATAADGKLAQVRDPESGERFSLLLSRTAGLRDTVPARLVDLELLPSLQGLVWRALSDGVAASVGDGRVVISRPGGLRLSAPSGHGAAAPEPAPPPRRHEAADAAPPHAAGSPPDPPAGDEPPMGLGNWPDLDATGRQRARARLVGEIPALPERERARARLDLARLYLADALGAEARTAVELLRKDDMATGPLRSATLALTGAAEALAGRQDPALANLLDPRLDKDGEVALWRAYAASRAARWTLAAQEWQRSGGLPATYPDPLRRRLGLDLAEGMLERGELADARALLEQLAALDLRGAEGARLKLLEGIAAGRQGQWPAAATALAAAAGAAGGGTDVATRARFLLISGRAEAGETTAEAAVAGLAGELRNWRGHGWEQRMLERLAELQAAAGRPVEAFATRREAIARIADPAAAAARGAQLGRELTDFLADERVPPLVRLAVQRMHGSLLDGTPAAERVRAALGTAAAESGLVETAAGLLASAGQAPEAAAGRAALASALAGRDAFAPALQRVAELPRAPAAVDLERELRGRAALAAGDPAAAARALTGVATPSGRELQQEVLARLGDWSALLQAAGADLEAATSGALGPAEARAAVWQGLAQAQLGRGAEAGETGTRYGQRMPDAETIGLLALATATAPPADREGTRSGEFAAALRRHLAALGKAGAPDGAGGIRTASARSGPAG